MTHAFKTNHTFTTLLPSANDFYQHTGTRVFSNSELAGCNFLNFNFPQIPLQQLQWQRQRFLLDRTTQTSLISDWSANKRRSAPVKLLTTDYPTITTSSLLPCVHRNRSPLLYSLKNPPTLLRCQQYHTHMDIMIHHSYTHSTHPARSYFLQTSDAHDACQTWRSLLLQWYKIFERKSAPQSPRTS